MLACLTHEFVALLLGFYGTTVVGVLIAIISISVYKYYNAIEQHRRSIYSDKRMHELHEMIK
jgi:hypothetical protein